jgi:uncharacterized protein (TIGR02246 family)
MPAHKPEECDRLFEYYLNAGDLIHLVMLYEDGCSLVRSDGGVGTGHAAVRAVYEPMLATRPRIKLEVVKVVRTGADLALVYNDWTFTATGADGSPVQRSGKAIEVVRRQPDGSWRVAIDDPVGRG